jgi:hypothetical protein
MLCNVSEKSEYIKSIFAGRQSCLYPGVPLAKLWLIRCSNVASPDKGIGSFISSQLWQVMRFTSLSARRPLLVVASCLFGGANDGDTSQKYRGRRQPLAQQKECRERAGDYAKIASNDHSPNHVWLCRHADVAGAWRSRQYSKDVRPVIGCGAHSMSQCTPRSAISRKPSRRYSVCAPMFFSTATVTDLPAASACAHTHSMSVVSRSWPRHCGSRAISMTRSVACE